MNDCLYQKVSFDIFSGRATVYLFGQPYDWRIEGSNRKDFLMRIDGVAQDLYLRNIYAPRPTRFNPVVCASRDLQESITLRQSRAVIWCGYNADGTMLEKKGDAFLMNTADCPTIITHDPENGLIIVAHAGRDSLIEGGEISNKQPRVHKTVICAIARCHGHEAMHRVRVWIVCGIQSKHFGHPWNHAQYGAVNKAMIEDVIERWGRVCVTGELSLGRISLYEIIRSQFLNLNVPSENIAYDGIDTFGDKDEQGKSCWWSNRRGDYMRNGVLVVKNW